VAIACSRPIRLTTLRTKIRIVAACGQRAGESKTRPGGPAGLKIIWSRGSLRLSRFFHSYDSVADVDEVVADDAEADPANHSGSPLVTATVEDCVAV
jgi:hypothetical protein